MGKKRELKFHLHYNRKIPISLWIITQSWADTVSSDSLVDQFTSHGFNGSFGLGFIVSGHIFQLPGSFISFSTILMKSSYRESAP